MKFAQGWHQDAIKIESPNFNARPAGAEIHLAVIHNISLPPRQFGGQAIEQLFTNSLDPNEHPYFEQIASLEVSSHFLIRRNGILVQFVSIDDRAWHAGQSCFQGQHACNDFSIGIELEGADDIPYTQLQYSALVHLLKALQQAQPALRFISGHEHIAPVRKTDPGIAFDWAYLKERLTESKSGLKIQI